MTHENPARLQRIRERALRDWRSLPERIDRYEIRGELGRGAMGIVYDGFDPMLRRRVAIKLMATVDAPPLQREFADRLVREMRAASRIFHSNVVSVLDAGVVDEGSCARPYYVMERVDGPSLGELLDERGKLLRNEALRLAAGIARGLSAVHARGLVHRDLKPSNVLLSCATGEAKVADFGLVTPSGEGVSEEGFAALGSAHYLAPEQVRSGEATPASDLFALGALLLRMCGGSEPFPAPTLGAHMARVLHDEPEGLGLLDPDLRLLVSDLMHKRAERRPQAAAEVADRLASLATASTGDATAQGPASPAEAGAAPPHRTRLVRWLAGAALALLVAFGAGTLASLRNQLLGLEAEAATQWMQVETQLVRQQELIPELVGVLDRYLSFERESLEAVLETTRATPTPGAETDRTLMSLWLLAGRAPGVHADRQFRSLGHEIAGARNRIALERTRYNESVGLLNQRLRQFPWRIVAGSLQERPYFDGTRATWPTASGS